MVLGEPPFDDVHALTGSLKLYFRELPEPLIPYDFFSGFVEAISEFHLVLFIFHMFIQNMLVQFKHSICIVLFFFSFLFACFLFFLLNPLSIGFVIKLNTYIAHIFVYLGVILAGNLIYLKKC